MKISSRSRYGIRAMLELAGRYGEGPVSLSEIADAQDIPFKYLEQIFISLKSAGLVKGVRGARGGYLLSRSPRKIEAIDIIKVLERSLSIVDCVEDPQVCDKSEECLSREIWLEMSEAVSDVLESNTLEDLLSKADIAVKEVD